MRATRSFWKETKSLNTCCNKVFIVEAELNIALEWVIL